MLASLAQWGLACIAQRPPCMMGQHAAHIYGAWHACLVPDAGKEA
jgi:hypothetical protein